jgi:hypothetical protein
VSGPGVRSGRSFLDFVIDGLSLYDEIGRRSDLISTLWVSPLVPEEQQKAVLRLLGLEQGDLPVTEFPCMFVLNVEMWDAAL